MSLLDRIGIWSSGICVVHCILLPVFVLSFPVLSKYNHELEEFWHSIFLVASCFFFAIAFASGYRHHKNFQPLIFGVIGCALLAVSYFFHDSLPKYLEVITVILGGLFLMGGHFWNHHCGHCHHDHSPIEKCQH